MTISPTTKAMPSGRLVDLLNPKPSDIDLTDICVTLANINRWGGATGQFYSVASHSLLVGDQFLNQRPSATCEQLACALLHDAAEAYVGDVATPKKKALRRIEGDIDGISGHDRMEDMFERTIADKLGLSALSFEIEDDIKAADIAAFYMESWALFSCDFKPEWREPILAYQTLTIGDLLVVPEDRSWAALHNAVSCCLHEDSRSRSGREYWAQTFGPAWALREAG